MGVNGQKLNFQANGRRWGDNGVETARNCFLSVYIIAIASSISIFVNNRSGGGQRVAHKQVQMGVNGQKLFFQANGRRWRDNGVETAWNSFFSILIIAIASSYNIFVNKRGGGGQGVAHKQVQMGVNGKKLNFQANGGRW